MQLNYLETIYCSYVSFPIKNKYITNSSRSLTASITGQSTGAWGYSKIRYV